MKLDVILLCDTFESFRDMYFLCIVTYGHYYTAPRIPFDCMLKHTKIKIELLHDIDVLLMLETGLEEG